MGYSHRDMIAFHRTHSELERQQRQDLEEVAILNAMAEFLALPAPRQAEILNHHREAFRAFTHHTINVAGAL